VGFYVGHAQGLDAVSLQMAQQEMHRLLAPAGIELVWNKTGQDVTRALIGSFEGSCSLDALSRSPFGYPGAGSLADTSVSSGRVQSYFRVDCSRLIRTLTPVLQRLSMPFRRAVFGRALGRVMAHEAYHILSQSKDHDETGAAKARFSLDDLTSFHFDFDLSAIERMRPIPIGLY
jgi:hypothetical protein